jgi:hypothetical protein
MVSVLIILLKNDVGTDSLTAKMVSVLIIWQKNYVGTHYLTQKRFQF